MLFLWAEKRFVPEERKNSFYSGKKGETKAKKVEKKAKKG